MKKISISYRLFSVLTATLLLLSSVPFSMDLHFCKDQLKKVSFYSQEQSCCKKSGEKRSLNSSFTFQKVSHCCSNHSITLENHQELTHPSHDLEYSLNHSLVKSLFTLPYLSLHLNEPIIGSKKEISFHHYTPPLLISDMSILFQQFLC